MKDSLVTLLLYCVQIACTWEDVKSLRRDLDKSTSAGVMQFRSKLLQAGAQLQVCSGYLLTKAKC